MTSGTHITKELFERYSCAVELDEENILLYTRSELAENSDIRNLLGLVSEERNGYWLHKARFATLNAFALRYALKGKIGRKTRITQENAKRLATYADRVELPTAKLAADGRAVEISAPNLKVYRELFVRLGATPTKDGHRLRLDKVIDLELHVNAWKSNLPAIELHKDLLKLNREPIPGFDGTVDSLREIPIGALNIVRANVQNWQALKKSKVTLEEKLAKFKLATLHDLLFRLPRRYIDKSKPQLIDDLIEGESATIIGRVTAISSFSTGVGGLRITVQDPTGESINSTFWRQGWLQKKFKLGDEVILTGAVNSWNGKVQLNGQTVEHFDEGTTLPIVPIYRQSESAGITSAFLISAIRELLQRLGDVKLPVYFKAEGRQAYKEMLTEFHTPSSLEAHEEAILAMAYYELIYMQLLIQDAKANTEKRPGLVLAGGDRGLQLKAAKALPYQLTGSQRKAVAKLNKKFADKFPSSSLLMADVGAGKGLLENERILTPFGWRILKDLKVGDLVIGRNGKATEIIGYYPQGEQELARITFSDKTSIITDMSHLWTVQPTNQFAAKYSDGKLPEYVVSTRQLLSDETSPILVNQKSTKDDAKQLANMKTNFLNSRGASKWKIPLIAEPVEYKTQSEPLPLDPYIFGYWLGDGISGSAELAVGKEDVDNTELLISERWPGYIERKMDKRNGNFSLSLKKEKAYGLNLLRSMGVHQNKHIPLTYLLASSSERLALLQGLMDSDGTVDKRNGSLGFSNNNKRIIEGLIELVQSLGGRAWISRERYAKYTNGLGEKVSSTKLSYEVKIDLPLEISPFLLKRKVEVYQRNWKAKNKNRSLTRLIKNVEKLPEKARTICIKVAANDELFVTKDFIVTHNTVVAQLSCLQAVDSGAQAVIVAPTDVLARQLHEETVKLAKLMKATYDVDISVVLMAGAMKAAEKKELNRQISSGEADIIVGTQAVFSSSVKYHNLGLVVIDEQQKFGAEQRTKLLESRDDGKVPDLLLQTATPIPRSMAQVYYADLEPITMKEKPGGRLPIATEWIQDDPVGILQDPLHPMWLDIMAEAQKGNQSFVITPMVVESTKVDAASVERAYKELSSNVLSHLRVGYVHGQMKMDEQRATMERFKRKELDVLVASTVIEVGVNIPDATRMVILSAERMGASSLHQIRGRVGRNSKPSKCYLVSLGKTESSVSRLQSLVDFEDGFEIAKVDLQTRGEGTMFSSDQSGRSDMIFANLAKHSNLIEDAKEEALRILRSPFKALALKDARDKFTSPERLF